MRVKPIIFSGSMVRAILDGRKSVTRRVIKPQPLAKLAYIVMGHESGKWNYPGERAAASWGEEYRQTELALPDKERLWTPPCHGDDILWVRETWMKDIFPEYVYKADVDDLAENCAKYAGLKWRPSIHMPKGAARLFLRVRVVRVERLWDMTEKDAIAEGYGGICPYNHMDFSTTPPEACFNSDSCSCDYWYCDHTLPEAFGREIWNPINAKRDGGAYVWDKNPWVWVIRFEPCEKPDGWPNIS